MASTDADSVPLPADPAFLTPPARVVKRCSFLGTPCRDDPGIPGRLVSCNILIKFVKEARAPHPKRSPGKTGGISAWTDKSDEESGK